MAGRSDGCWDRDVRDGLIGQAHCGVIGCLIEPAPGYNCDMKHTPQTRARAARLLREGKSYSRVERETGVNKSTLKRWKKDPDFLSLIHGRGVLTLGHVQVRAAEGDVLEQVPCEESRVWIGDGCVLGSLLVEGAMHLRAVFIATPERVQAVRGDVLALRGPSSSNVKRSAGFLSLRPK